MELRQLEYFVAVAEEANFTRAAARVHVAQPGVSAQIRQLEHELGQQLFDRTGRTVRLTEAGAAMLPYARAALEAVIGARLAVDELTGLVRGRVAVGMLTACSIVALFDLLESFHQRYPAIDLTLSEANSDHLIEALQSGKLAGAGLDVFEKEPLPADSPLRRLGNVLLTSHAASASERARDLLQIKAAEAVRDILQGKRPEGALV